MDKCDYPVIFVDRSNPKLKNQDLDEESLKKSFNNLKMKFIFDKDELDNYIMSFEQLNLNLLLMSSGKFGGIDVDRLSKNFCNNVG
jgi:UDP-N-acetylmuramate: L-alanyl-gamma-D-glutamyl-meso-diaminopimelate ligase